MRHELKYYINSSDIPAIAQKLGSIMSVDSHADSYGGYKIRSLYFDDVNHSAYFDKLMGVRDRDKYRLRMYGLDFNNLFIERKRKLGDLIDKDSVKISRGQALRLMAGDPTGLDSSQHPLLNDIFTQMTLNRLRPVVIVDYDRQAFVHPGGNTRVTIDRHVSSGLNNLDPFDRDILTLDAMDRSRAILEVKYDNMLPDFIASALSSFSGARSAISKYVMCARYVI